MKKTKLLFILAVPFLVTACGTNTCDSSDTSTNVSSSEDVTSDEVEKMVVNSVPLVQSTGEVFSYLPTFFINGIQNIPYLDVQSTMISTVNDKMSVSEENDVLTFTHQTTKATLKVNAKENTVTFSDYYALFENTNSVNYATSSIDTSCFKQTSVLYESTTGSTEKIVDLDDYNLDIYDVSGMILMPAATFFDLFLGSIKIAFNGTCFYVNSNIYDSNYQLTEYGSAIKEVPETYVYDKTLRDFSYNELCLSLDFHYAMSDLRGYPSFTKLLVSEGIKDIIYDGEPSTDKFDEAMIQLFNVLLTDYGHTLLNRSGTNLFRSEAFDRDDLHFAQKMYDSSAICNAIEKERESQGIKTYLISDYVATSKTYVINFNSFTWFNRDDDGNYLPDNCGSSASLIKVANDYIHEHWDEIDNVIIDLSCNGGGADIAELYTSSWVHGKATQRCFAPQANLKAESDYVADVNMDGVYDDYDNIVGKKVYIITSDYSYSNGNVFPGEMKGTKDVTLIGQKTGGGSCNVFEFSTVIGNSYRLSSLTRATDINWGSIETGVEPDIVIDNPINDCHYADIIKNYIAK